MHFLSCLFVRRALSVRFKRAMMPRSTRHSATVRLLQGQHKAYLTFAATLPAQCNESLPHSTLSASTYVHRHDGVTQLLRPPLTLRVATTHCVRCLRDIAWHAISRRRRDLGTVHMSACLKIAKLALSDIAHTSSFGATRNYAHHMHRNQF